VGYGQNGWYPKECSMGDVDKAESLFRSGCACSQAVLGTYGPRFGLNEDEAMRVSAGFAGGMRMAETCGAVTGAFMVLGLAYCDGKCRTAEGRKRAYEKVVSFAEEFKARHESLACRELLGCDISTPEGARLATEKGLFRSECPELVRSAAELVEARLPNA
jgi:C_GCAxxG_C_C family probable redox protein